MLRRDYHAPFAEAWLISDGHDVFELCKKKADIVSVLRRPGQLCLPTMVLDIGATAQELMELAASHSQMTIAEIRERIAQGHDAPQTNQRKTRVVTV